jgi:hypothetical protein
VTVQSPQSEQPQFLDVERLLRASVPRPRAGWFGYALSSLVLVVLMSAIVVVKNGAPREQVQVMSAVAVLGILCGVAGMFVTVVRKHRAESAMVQAAGELVQLRRWPQAAIVLEQILSRPSTSNPLRTQTLVYLASVLARYHRFNDAIAVQNHLLDNELIDASIAFGLRVGRAMAMLREDHLFDADRAISELRRLEGTDESAGLALVEIYRDVKTGHPDEAIDIFQSRLPTMRDQLGHRVADAYALVSRAFDLRSRDAESRDAWGKATLLAPAMELVRRYPEVKPVAEKYPPSPAPADALG